MCMNDDEEKIDIQPVPSLDEVDEVVNNLPTMPIIHTDTEVEEEVVIEPTQEILDAELADNKVQLGNHVIQFPISFQDFIDKIKSNKVLDDKMLLVYQRCCDSMKKNYE